MTVSRGKVVAGYGQTQKPFRVGERIIRGNTTAGGRSDRVEFLHSQEFDQFTEIFRTDSRIVFRRQIGVVIVPPRIGDDTLAALGEYGLLV